MKIDHIALYVKDLEVSKAFYETFFGAKSNELTIILKQVYTPTF